MIEPILKNKTDNQPWYCIEHNEMSFMKSIAAYKRMQKYFDDESLTCAGYSVGNNLDDMFLKVTF